MWALHVGGEGKGGGERVWGGFSGTVREGEQQEEELEFANKAPSPFLKKKHFSYLKCRNFTGFFSREQNFFPLDGRPLL